MMHGQARDRVLYVMSNDDDDFQRQDTRVLVSFRQIQIITRWLPPSLLALASLSNAKATQEYLTWNEWRDDWFRFLLRRD
jgi:hypothetical protein